MCKLSRSHAAMSQPGVGELKALQSPVRVPYRSLQTPLDARSVRETETMATGSRIQRMQQGVRTGECQRRSALEAAYRDPLARVSRETLLRGHDLAFPGECHLPIEIEPGRLRQARADLAKHAHDPYPRGELYAGDLRASGSACKRKFAADLEGEGPRNAVAHLGQRIEGRDDE